MKLWLDDEREAPPGWLRIGSVSTAKEMIQNNKVEAISLDNDLGKNEIEGYKLMDWMEERAMLGLRIPRLILVHTGNPVARHRMLTTLARIESMGRYY